MRDPATWFASWRVGLRVGEFGLRVGEFWFGLLESWFAHSVLQLGAPGSLTSPAATPSGHHGLVRVNTLK